MVVENPDNYSLDSQISGVLVTDCDSLALFAFFFLSNRDLLLGHHLVEETLVG